MINPRQKQVFRLLLPGILQRKDAGRHEEEYSCNGIDVVTDACYNNKKEVDYVYQTAGGLVEMTGWKGC